MARPIFQNIHDGQGRNASTVANQGIPGNNFVVKAGSGPILGSDLLQDTERLTTTTVTVEVGSTRDEVVPPSSIDGLLFWHEAGPNNVFSDILSTTVTSSNSNVAIVKDKSNNGRHLRENTSSKQPVLVGYDYYNGQDNAAGAPASFVGTSRSALRFAGNDGITVSGSISDWPRFHGGLPNDGGTLYITYAQNDTGNLHMLFDTGGLAGAAGMTLYVDDQRPSVLGRLQCSIRGGSAQILNIAAGATANVVPAKGLYTICMTVGSGVASADNNYHVNIYADESLIVNGNLSNNSNFNTNPVANLNIGRTNAESFFSQMHVYFVAGYSGIHNRQTRRKVFNYCADTFGSKVNNVACIGDSTTLGAVSNGISTPWPAMINESMGPRWRSVNFGVNGSQVASMKTNYESTTIGGKRRRFNIVSVLAGVNNLRNDVAVTGDLGALYDSILTSGDNNILLAMSHFPFKGDTAWTEARQTSGDLMVDFIEEYVSTHNDAYYLDVYSIMEDPDNLDKMRPQHTFDYLHPNQTGLNYIFPYIRDKLLEITDSLDGV